MRPLVLVFAIAASCCTPPPPQCPSRLDDAETPAELSAGDACERAGVNLKTACPKLWRADWPEFCREMTKQGVPLCPAKLAKVKTCAEADRVCR